MLDVFLPYFEGCCVFYPVWGQVFLNQRMAHKMHGGAEGEIWKAPTLILCDPGRHLQECFQGPGPKSTPVNGGRDRNSFLNQRFFRRSQGSFPKLFVKVAPCKDKGIFKSPLFKFCAHIFCHPSLRLPPSRRSECPNRTSGSRSACPWPRQGGLR